MIDKIKVLELSSDLSEAKNGTERVEIAAKIVDLDGTSDSADMSDHEIIRAARKIIAREMARLAAS